MISDPTFSIVIPARSEKDPQLQDLLKSIRLQDWKSLEVLVITEGNSEQAKAIGIQRSKGRYIGLFCADNFLRDPSFLRAMNWYFSSHREVVGIWSAQYDYVPSDRALSRYFALLGANDPLCWWLGKADRQSHIAPMQWGTLTFQSGGVVPSIGCNGFFVRSEAMKKVVTDIDRHFPMDAVVDLIRAGHTEFFVCPQRVWHKSGESFFDYFRRRYVYARELYFKKRDQRRWHMVDRRDWSRVLLFVVGSFFVLPHLWTAWVGYRRVRDPAWFLHPVVCFALTILYGVCFLRWGLFRRASFSAPTTGPIHSNGACGV